jgi:aminopeptidase N
LLIYSFTSFIGTDLTGFYRNSYQDLISNLTRHLAVTQFESHYARKAFPCLDEPDFKAEFTISITAKTG